MRLVKVCATGSTTSCLPFLTTADETGNDGDDALFGDGGNDWMSGGTGVDHLYGGWGHDLLDVDDDKTTMNGANSKVDNDSNADYAFGGAGRDVLIANTKSDRLIDWVGEFNSYLVPFNQFGASTVWRASAPAVRQFLYDLSKGRRCRPDPRPGRRPQRRALRRARADQLRRRRVGGPARGPDDPQPGNGGTFSLGDGHDGPGRHHGVCGEHGVERPRPPRSPSRRPPPRRQRAARRSPRPSVAENKKGGTLTVHPGGQDHRLTSAIAGPGGGPGRGGLGW